MTSHSRASVRGSQYVTPNSLAQSGDGIPTIQRDTNMARRYSRASGNKVRRAMHEMKRGKLRSGRSGLRVKSRKQAIAIGLSEARRAGAKVPRKKSR